MNHEVQLLFLMVLGLAGQVVAVGGALLAFRLGTRTGEGHHRVRSSDLSASKPVLSGHSTPGALSAELRANLDAQAVALLRCLRLPPVADQEALLAWYSRLQLEGMALAATMPPETQTVFRQALDAIRDILDTHNLDDRYELLAAALLPVYEGIHAKPFSPAEAVQPLTAADPLNRFTSPTTPNREASPMVSYREAPSPVVAKNRLASLFEQIKASAATGEPHTSNPASTRHGEALPSGSEALPSGQELPRNGGGKATSEASDYQSPGTQLDTSRLSQRLAEILRTADRNDYAGDPRNSNHSSSEPTTADHSAPELHLVSPPIKSRLRRSGTLTPEQEVARKAAHVVGRAREWYGRPDITLREVQSACAAFGLEFNEVAARAELAKPLVEDIL